MRGQRQVLPEGDIYYLTVDRKTLQENQANFRKNKNTREDKPPIWIQINDDKQNRINCWHVIIRGASEMVYGPPNICGAMVYMQTESELEYWV